MVSVRGFFLTKLVEKMLKSLLTPELLKALMLMCTEKKKTLRLTDNVAENNKAPEIVVTEELA